jgi:hypothetical protein
MLSIIEGINWLGAVEKGGTNADSLLPLLIKTALDGAKVGAGNPGAIMALLADIEADLPSILGLFTANNAEATPAPATSGGAS